MTLTILFTWVTGFFVAIRQKRGWNVKHSANWGKQTLYGEGIIWKTVGETIRYRYIYIPQRQEVRISIMYHETSKTTPTLAFTPLFLRKNMA